MNANGALYHLFLGEDDWGRCAVRQGDASTRLGEIWAEPMSVEERERLPEWRDDLSSIAISRLPQQLAPTVGEARLRLEDRRGAVADRHGNIYSVASDSASIEVQAAGQRHVSPFWPDPRGAAPGDHDAFADCEPDESARALGALGVLCGDYLVAVLDRGTLLRFDLVGGGEPETIAVPELPELQIDALACMGDGGAILLDGEAKRLYRLNGDLRLCGDDPADPVESLFQPADGPARAIAVEFSPWSIDLSPLDQPISVVLPGEDRAVVLDHKGGADCELFEVDLLSGAVAPLLACEFDALGMVLAPQDENAETRTALLWSAIGNQAHAVTLVRRDDGWVAGEDPELRPMRRFGGRGLVAASSLVFYDSGEPLRWVALATKHRCRFAEATAFLTPVMDSGIYQCNWDRIRFDGRIPPGCAVRIEARAFDDEAFFAIDPDAGWALQPQPYANGDGAELPKLAFPRLADPDETPRKCWDMLLQNVLGRHVQLRITLVGDGRQSPAIAALRLWYPRFSYSERFLPRVYSQDAAAGGFVERFLANMEGVNTSLEDRIAAARLLIDPRTVPEEALGWLADWFDVALDPSWDERRRRLFIKYAVTFFGWRGTVPGLSLALALAFDPDIEECDFALPGPAQRGLSGIRIVEQFRTRKSARAFAQAGPIDAGIHAVIDPESLWQPAEGKQGLVERWARVLGDAPASPALKSVPFSLVAGDYEEPDWPAFIQTQAGFVPHLGGEERRKWQEFLTARGIAGQPQSLPDNGAAASRAAWQDYLSIASRERALWHALLTRRYAGIAQLNQAWNSDWRAITDIPIPAYLPGSVVAIRDWLDFEGQLAPIHGAAHRFSVLIPRSSTAFDSAAEQAALQLAQRIIALEKPAHTVFDVRFFWAMNRVGEARVGRDTELGQGSRAPQLIPSSVLGRSAIGASFAGGPQQASDGRELLSC